jgi:PKD repeat protein
VVANFTVDVDEGCNALDVQFTNSSTGLGSYSWDFDDGSLSSLDSPLKTFSHQNRANSEIFTVRLTSTNQFGCNHFVERDITVYPLVEAAFAISDEEGCTPYRTYISNSTISTAYVYSWDFGNGDNSALAQPDSVLYQNNVPPPLVILEPNIVLETSLNPAVYPEGCPETFTDQVRVYPHIFPAFTANLDGCHPLPVEFTNQTEAYGGTNNATYLWTFGNGVESNFTDFSQNYYNASLIQDTIFRVTLRAYSEHGCADSVYQDVTVYPKPQSRMELVSNYFACSPYDVEIQNNSVGKGYGSSLEFFYEFGDGTDSTTLSGNNMDHFYRNLTSDIEPYIISLSIETEDGCQDTSYQTIYVYPEVTASFNFDPGDAACNPFLVTMQNNSTNALTYKWDFDDDLGTTSSLFEPSHRFVNNTMDTRYFNVSLTAVSEFQCEHTVNHELTVYSSPDANFSILPPLKLFPDAEFTFKNLTFPSSDLWSYTWTFGDGYGDNVKDPAPHTYQTWGPAEDDFQYLVTLIVENTNCSDTISNYLTLRPAQPIAYYEANEQESCSPLIVYFDNLSEYYFPNPDATAFEWDFGDGTTSNERDPVHTYQDSGFYNVSLTAFGDGGESTFFSVFRVHENPVAMFAVAPQRVMLPDAGVHMYNLSINGYTYLWDFGDGTFPSYRVNKDPVHTYTTSGEFRVSLTAYTKFGCMDSTSMFPAVWVQDAGEIRFPNAFMPSKLGPNNGFYDEVDYKNEVFHPYADGVVEYKLFIFNRWGEQLFLSEDIKIGWDGYYKGKLSSQDVYVWRAIGKFTNGSPFDLRGNVTLLR